MESKANKIISEKIEEEDLTCQPTELNKADVKGHCRSVADKVFQEGIQSERKRILEIIDKKISDHDRKLKLSLYELTEASIHGARSELRALRDSILEQKSQK